MSTTDLRDLQSFAEFFGRRHTPVVVHRGERALRVGLSASALLGHGPLRAVFGGARNGSCPAQHVTPSTRVGHVGVTSVT